MKKIIIISAIAATSLTLNANKIEIFSMERTFDDVKPVAEGSVASVIIDGTTKLSNVKVSGAIYGSTALTSRDKLAGTSLTNKEGGNTLFVGEANIEYAVDDLSIKVGRQKLNTPLANAHKLRALPTSYEAATVSYKGAELTFISKSSGFASKNNGFERPESWGKGLLSASYKGKDYRVQAIASLNAPEGAPSAYYYADGKLEGEKGYLKLQVGGNAYNGGKGSLLLGAKAGKSFNGVDFAVLTDKISGNRFKSVEAGPMYSDWQQGYSQYEESTAYGAQIIVHPSTNSSIKLGYVDVKADAGNVRDDFSETNIDAKWKLSKDMSLRGRISVKNQTPQSDREDRNDFRLIATYSW